MIRTSSHAGQNAGVDREIISLPKEPPGSQLLKYGLLTARGNAVGKNGVNVEEVACAMRMNRMRNASMRFINVKFVQG